MHIVLVAVKPQKETQEGRAIRLFIRAKSNIGADHGGFEYELQQAELDAYPGIFTSSILWGSKVEGSARELLSTAETVDDGSKQSVLSEF